jgi:hypothetical protein
MTNVTITQWGPHIWHTLHYVSLGYPKNPTLEQKEYYRQYYTLYKYVLPCSICAAHYAENLEKIPLTDEIMSDREKLIRWVIDLHNEVNRMKGKPVMEVTKARELIESQSECKHINGCSCNCSKMKNNNFNLLFVILAALIFIAVVYKKK